MQFRLNDGKNTYVLEGYKRINCPADIDPQYPLLIVDDEGCSELWQCELQVDPQEMATKLLKFLQEECGMTWITQVRVIAMLGVTDCVVPVSL